MMCKPQNSFQVLNKTSGKRHSRTLVNIYGTSRSGSTMLDLMLGNARDAFSCGEVSAWFRPYRKHHRKIECSCMQVPCIVWEKLSESTEFVFYEKAFKELDVSFIIDSSKDICWFIDAQAWAAASNINVFNLLIWKHPVDLAYSYWKRGKSVNYWRAQFVKTYSKVLQVGIPYFAVNCQDLTQNPSGKLAEICLAIHMPYFVGKERFWEKDHHYLFGSAGIRSQVYAQSSVIEDKKEYPREFESQRAELQTQIAGDEEVQYIINSLKQKDVAFMKKSNLKSLAFLPERNLPVWYFRKKVERWIRRYIPEKYDPSATKDAETVPLAKT